MVKGRGVDKTAFWETGVVERRRKMEFPIKIKILHTKNIYRTMMGHDNRKNRKKKKKSMDEQAPRSPVGGRFIALWARQ
jgi:hypothetical protein